ncbi:LON peptidase substrate-binding domain-containing protein [Amycolatopsis xylanica]|uniref:LON peptidase substrate-binding domain-containing protein n=1 Tax=Amycolatopsis xylanica TaxID=589385 RepID=UPI000B84A1FF|nr:LON peptidase substrate-binding domain-containing protein [Amycolatopsis xylanica]
MANPVGGRATTTLPLFPLQTVLLPGVHLPLHIFEPRYRQLTVDLVTGTVPSQEFGVIAIKAALVREIESVDHLHAVGCTAQLREAKRLPDGRFDVVTTGRRRFRLLEVDTTSAPYLVGTVEWLPDEPLPAGSTDVADRLSTVARAAHQRYCDSAWESDDWHVPPPDTPAQDLAYLLAADCLLPLADRQRLLEETQPLRRLRMLCRLLTREAGFLSTLRAVPAPMSEFADLTGPSTLN